MNSEFDRIIYFDGDSKLYRITDEDDYEDFISELEQNLEGSVDEDDLSASPDSERYMSEKMIKAGQGAEGKYFVYSTKQVLQKIKKSEELSDKDELIEDITELKNNEFLDAGNYMGFEELLEEIIPIEDDIY